MIKGVTDSGFEFEVNEKSINDWEYSRLINKFIVYEKKLQESEGKGNEADLYEKIHITEVYQDTLEEILNYILKESGKKAFFDFIKEKNEGYIPAVDVQGLFNEVIHEITKQNNTAKKSTPSPTS